MALVLVYGTLKSTERNHRYMRGAMFIAEGITAQKQWDMIEFYAPENTGPVPAVMQGGERAIKGEIHQVSFWRLWVLDIFESKHYKRVKAEVTNTKQKAWLYVARSPSNLMLQNHKKIQAQEGGILNWTE